MSLIKWDQDGERTFETGVDHGVLYLRDLSTGEYNRGFAWNGLTTVTESPSGAESNKQYADNRVYLNLISAEEFSGTIEAFTFPDEFAACDGTAEIAPGVSIGQQNRETFGFAYRSKIGNDLVGQDAGYKLNLVYGCLAAPTEKAHETVNESPEASNFSWEISTTPVEVGTVNGVTYKPTATVTINSLTTDPDDLAILEEILFGADATTEPVAPATIARLPLPREIYELFAA